MPQQVLSVVMAGRSGGEPMLAAARAGIPDPWHASLREDYLNQVQRDFLSRRARCLSCTATPLANGHLRIQVTSMDSIATSIQRMNDGLNWAQCFLLPDQSVVSRLHQ